MAAPTGQRMKKEPESTLAPESDRRVGCMQDPIGSMERAGVASAMQRNAAVSPAAEDTMQRANPGLETGRQDKGFTRTFAVAAIVLLIAFMIALYFGTQTPEQTPQTSEIERQVPLTETTPAVSADGEQTHTSPATAPTPDTAPATSAPATGGNG